MCQLKVKRDLPFVLVCMYQEIGVHTIAISALSNMSSLKVVLEVVLLLLILQVLIITTTTTTTTMFLKMILLI